MATDKALLDTFDKILQYLNGHNFSEQSWKPMDPLLDDNVIIKKFDEPGYLKGKAAVKTYFLYGNGKSYLPSCWTRKKDVQIVGNNGFISGFADSVEATTNPPSPPQTVAYSATFSEATGIWKMISVWGSCWP